MTAKPAANLFFLLSSEEKKPLTPAELQLLLYALEKEYEKQTGEKLYDETADEYACIAYYPSVLSASKMKERHVTVFPYRNTDGSADCINLQADTVLMRCVRHVWQRFKALYL